LEDNIPSKQAVAKLAEQVGIEDKNIMFLFFYWLGL
jgi:hypothetical protein